MSSFRELAGRPARVWSPLQTAVFDDVEAGPKHTVVVARAGSGKTSTIVESLGRVPRGASVLMVAFNKVIERELAARAPRGVDVRTLHAFGLRIITTALGRVEIDDRKPDRLLAERLGDRATKEQRTALKKATSLAKATLATDAAAVRRLVDAFDIDVAAGDEDAFADLVLELLDDAARDTRTVDYDDMVWLPVRLGLRARLYDRVFVDETQDLNACQLALTRSACRPGGRICAVGDDRQAIYAWRGADPDAVPRMVRELDATVLPLSVTYRCARRIVDVAKRVVPDLEAAPGAEEGVVDSASSAQMKRDVGPGDFILSRTNAPLVGACLEFLAEGRPASVAGRDIGAGLESLVRQSRATTVAELVVWVGRWAAAEAARLLQRERDPSIAYDKAECLERLAAGARSLDDVRARLASLFSDGDDRSRIVLSTTHKAKGLERDRVWVLASTYRRASLEEDNLWYVAVTRARSDLRLVA